jgi:outer membrane protein W
MNKIDRAFGLVLFVLGATPLWAEDSAISPITPIDPPPLPPVSIANMTQAPTEKVITFGLAPLVSVPLGGNAAKEYNAGVGGEVFVGYTVDQNFLVGLDVGAQDYAVNATYFASTFQQTYGVPLPGSVTISGDFVDIPLMAMARYSFGESAVRPYLLFGAGIAFNQVSQSAVNTSQSVSVTATEADFFMAPGLGLAIRAAKDLELFAQVRLDMDFTSRNNNIPFTLTQTPGSSSTVYGNLSGDRPTLFIPFQVGVRFL